eukprot:31487-Pelagococcus_subviridis.AAC.8
MPVAPFPVAHQHLLSRAHIARRGDDERPAAAAEVPLAVPLALPHVRARVVVQQVDVRDHDPSRLETGDARGGLFESKRPRVHHGHRPPPLRERRRRGRATRRRQRGVRARQERTVAVELVRGGGVVRRERASLRRQL